MNRPATLFERHPPPWTIFSGVIFDGRGVVVDVSQAKVRAELVEAVNARLWSSNLEPGGHQARPAPRPGAANRDRAGPDKRRPKPKT